MKPRAAISLLLALATVILSVGSIAGQARTPASMQTAFGKLPLYIVENRGVYPDEVKYYIQGADKTLFFTDDGVTFALRGKEQGWTVKLDFVDANKVEPQGRDKQQAVFSYFRGSEKDWKTGLPTYSKVVYRDLWPGIDLVYNGTVNELKYEFVVAPGADPSRIRLRYRGAHRLTIRHTGALNVETPEGSFEDAPPVAWQQIDGKRVPVEMAYALGEGGEFGFGLGEHDATAPLILDPAVLVYCGYIGGSIVDIGLGIAMDAAGNVYVTGTTYSDQNSFPVKVGPDLTFNSRLVCDSDIFVAKVDASGSALVYCGYIGGSKRDYGNGITVDASGNAYVTGETESDETTFPVKVGPDLIFNRGGWDAFVAKVSASGAGLVYCGYIGGIEYDHARGVAVDGAGNAYVTGGTESDEQTFPVTVGPDLTHSGIGVSDGFVAKVNPQGAALVYCGYIGGIMTESGEDVAVDQTGSAYVVGNTSSSEQTFPVAVGPDLTYNGGQWDAFLAKINASGRVLDYCGYIGGRYEDHGYGIAVDVLGNAYVTGETESDETTFPVKVGPDLSHNGGSATNRSDAFVAKVSASGESFAYCGYIGGSSREWGSRIAVDASGYAYVAGRTSSDETTFPVGVGPDLTFKGGSTSYPYDVFVAKVDASGSTLRYCGYIGGSSGDCGEGIAVDASGNAYVAGWTESTQATFPVAVGPDLISNGGIDAFVAKIALVLLEASGTTRPGGAVSLNLTASDDLGLPYQVGSSLGTGPIPVDTRMLNLSPDSLLAVSAGNLWPGIFSDYSGIIDSKGQAQAAINIPNTPALIGIHLHTAFVTLDPQAPSGIKSISNSFSFSITK